MCLFGVKTGGQGSAGFGKEKFANSVRCLKGCEIYACFKWEDGLWRVLFKPKTAPLNANSETSFAQFP